MCLEVRSGVVCGYLPNKNASYLPNLLFADNAERSANNDFWLYSANVSRRNNRAYNTYLWATVSETVSISVDWTETGNNPFGSGLYSISAI